MKKSFYYTLNLLIFLIALTSCEKDSYKVTGSITNISDRVIPDANIVLYHQGTDDEVYSTVCDESGSFVFESAKEGYYDIGVTAEGYIEKRISINLKDNLTRDIQLIGAAAISGNILDALTGLGVDSVIVGFTTDTNVSTTIDAQLVVTTDKNGKFEIDSFSFPTGTFRIIIDTSAYMTKIVDGIQIVSGSNELGDISLLTRPDVNEYKLFLTWGFEPTDLDAHLTGPDGAGDRFHICYWNRINSDSSVTLDLDDSWRYGPETITIHNLKEGIYKYSVHNYSDQSANGGLGIYNSPAHVEIIGSEGLVRKFYAPDFSGTTGNTWHVFEIHVVENTIDFITVDTYEFAENDSDMEIFKK